MYRVELQAIPVAFRGIGKPVGAYHKGWTYQSRDMNSEHTIRHYNSLSVARGQATKFVNEYLYGRELSPYGWDSQSDIPGGTLRELVAQYEVGYGYRDYTMVTVMITETD